jgi:hypothetical protein
VNIPLWLVTGSRIIVLTVTSRFIQGLLAGTFENGGKSGRSVFQRKKGYVNVLCVMLGSHGAQRFRASGVSLTNRDINSIWSSEC